MQYIYGLTADFVREIYFYRSQADFVNYFVTVYNDALFLRASS